MSGVNRPRRHRPTDPLAAVIGQSLGEIEKRLDDMDETMMMTVMNPSVVIPEPGDPYKLDERTENGKFYLAISIFIPTNQEVDRVRNFLIRKSSNAVKAGETTEEARERARRELNRNIYSLEITEEQIAEGRAEGEIGPIDPAEDDDNAYQLIRLVSSLSGMGAQGKNPEENPFSADTFPFPALTVRSDGGSEENNKFFTVGDGIGTCSKPDVNLLTDPGINKVNLDTQAADATVGPPIYASQDQTKTFREQDITEAYAVFRATEDGTDETVNAGKKNVLIGGLIDDPDAKVFIPLRVLPLAKEYRWVRNDITNASRNKPLKVFPDSEQILRAGGTLPTNGIPELITAPTLTFTTLTADKAALDLTITQPSPNAVLLKRVVFQTQRADGSWKNIDPPILLLDQETALLAGSVTVFTREVQVKKNQSAQNFRVKIIGVGHKDTPSSANIERIIAVGGSTAVTAPATPIDADIESVPDDTTNTAQAKTNITVRRQAGETFAASNITGIGAIIRKAKASGGGTQDDADDAADSKAKEYRRGLDASELTLTSASLNIPGLPYDKRHVLKKTFFEVDGSMPIKSAAGNVAFIAGNKSAVGLSALTLLAPTRVRIDERHSDITAQYNQPAAGQPVRVESMVLFRKRPSDAAYIKLEPAANLSSNPDYSSNTSGTTPNTATSKFVTFNVTHPKNTDGILYFYRLRDGNGNSVDSPIFTDSNTGSGGPNDLPSPPAAVDINTFIDPETGAAIVEATIYADWTRLKTFTQVGADTAYAVIVNQGASATASGREFPVQLSETDLGAVSVKVVIDELKKGKRYKFRRTITSKDGVRVRSQVTDVPFTAGFSSATFASVGIAIALEAVDDRTSNAVITLTQPTPPAGLERLVVSRTLPIPPPGRTWSTAPKEVGRVTNLSQDLDIAFAAQSKAFPFQISHPRGATNIFVQGTLVSIDGAKRMVSGFISSGDEDTGTPNWVSIQRNARVKWSTTALRFNCNLPDTNFNRKVAIKCTIRIDIFDFFGTFYFWNPNEDVDTFLPNITPLFNAPTYYISAESTQIIFNVDKPTASNRGGLPLQIWNDLQASGGKLTITTYFYNGLTTSAGTAGQAFDDIMYLF